MDTRDALMRTICQYPKDDGPRLVFADYSEETGDTDLAEFIRIQVELAHKPVEESLFKQLKARVMTLFEGPSRKEPCSNYMVWTREVRNYLVGNRCFIDNFIRGFVGSIEVTWEEWYRPMLLESMENVHIADRTLKADLHYVPQGLHAKIPQVTPLEKVTLTSFPRDILFTEVRHVVRDDSSHIEIDIRGSTLFEGQSLVHQYVKILPREMVRMVNNNWLIQEHYAQFFSGAFNQIFEKKWPGLKIVIWPNNIRQYIDQQLMNQTRTSRSTPTTYTT